MGKLTNFLRKDSAIMGAILGILCPAIIFGTVELIIHFAEMRSEREDIISTQKVILLSVIPNLFLLRYYLLKLKFDLTGRGILGVTMILGLIFAILEFAAN